MTTDNCFMKNTLTIINPPDWAAPRGYANGVLAPSGGRMLFIAGQIAWDAEQHMVSSDFVAQFDQALANVLAVITAAGGQPENLARIVIYVTDKREYAARVREIGHCWRARLGRHYPAMALVEVKSLLEDAAQVEIEGVAVI